MIGGITTYLIIYIQFYALFGAKDGSDVEGPAKAAPAAEDAISGVSRRVGSSNDDP